MPTFVELVEPYITLQNAAAWQAETDKWVWVVTNILDEINLRAGDARVNYIEERFEQLLAAHDEYSRSAAAGI